MMSAVGTKRDVEMIDDPMRWPQMRLPVKNPDRYNTDKPSLGWLFAGMEWEGRERVVHLGNVFDAAASGEERYQDTWALVDAGWVVD
jgi:hypothetical protein